MTRTQGLVAGALALAGLVLFVACETRGGSSRENPGPSRPPGSAPPEADPAGTKVLLTAKTQVHAKQNLVWCATIQIAWDELVAANGRAWATMSGGERLGLANPFDHGIRLGPPTPPDVLAELNRGRSEERRVGKE